ncbi:MAG: PorV/PorQ family protein [Ignavibacteriaceae bacterium]|nr:PorV/PorQ family protein [Ignavibacteriaceae bacterium]
MPKNLLSAIILVLFFTFLQVNAQTVISKYAGEFLAIGVGGRPLGMGGAYVAVANDVTAGYYNPAGLARINYPEISLMHDARFGNLENYDYAGVAIPFDNDMSFGLSIMRLAVDGIPDTRNALMDITGSGSLDDVNRLDYSKITEFSDQDWAFYLTFAKKQSENFFYGANIKIIRRNIAEYSAWGVGFDAGAIYCPMDKLSLGLNLQDITTTMVAWSTGRNELISPTVKVGGAYEVNFLGGIITPALDLDIRFENRQFASEFHIGPVSFDGHFGFEYNFKNIFAVRAGYNDVKQFTIGAGVKLPKLNIDYSFARFSGSSVDNLDDTHRISIMLTLEEPKFLRSGM